MKKSFSVIACLVLCGIILFSGIGCTSEQGAQNESLLPARVNAAGELASGTGAIISQQNLGLWVSGSGKATAIPDIVLLSLGVESLENSIAQAQQKAADGMDKIIQVLKQNGIADSDIQTSRYNIEQVTRWDEKENNQIIIGYRVTNMVNVKIRKVDQAGSIIDSTVSAGGDLIRINSISFTVDDPTPLMKIAREKALNDAMDKAKQIASVSGSHLGKLLYVSENSESTPIRNTYLKYSLSGSVAASPTSINAGGLEYQVTMQLVYEIK